MDRTRLLIRMSAVYALIGTFIGSHMAGAGDYAYRPIHAHILLVGWLSLFAFGVYYRIFSIPKSSVLAKVHVWSSILGSFGLTVGMWLYFVKPIEGIETVNLLFFIIGGSILLIAFVVFALMTFVQGHLVRESDR
jgi:hypothetical protein